MPLRIEVIGFVVRRHHMFVPTLSVFISVEFSMLTFPGLAVFLSRKPRPVSWLAGKENRSSCRSLSAGTDDGEYRTPIAAHAGLDEKNNSSNRCRSCQLNTPATVHPARRGGWLTVTKNALIAAHGICMNLNFVALSATDLDVHTAK